MAIISVNSSAKLDSFTWTSADQFYIYNGSTLTIDADPMAKAGVFLPSCIAQAYGGSIIFDSRQIKHITVSNTTGFVYGSVFTGGTSGATGYFIKTTVAGVIKYRSTSTAQFVSGETITGTGISCTASSVPRVACMYATTINNSNIQAYSGGKLELLGEWFELGTADGTGTFTFTNNYEALYTIPALWVETGVGTNVYKKWLNKPSNLAFTSTFGNDTYGNFYTHLTTNTSVTFGSGTQGARPVNGARIRIPNCVIAPGNATNNGLNYSTTTGGILKTTNGGNVTIDKAAIGTRTDWTNIGVYSITNSSFLGAQTVKDQISTGSVTNVSVVPTSTLVFGSIANGFFKIDSANNSTMINDLFTLGNIGASFIIDNTKGVTCTVDNCNFYSYSSGNPLSLTNSANVVLTGNILQGTFSNIVGSNNIQLNGSIVKNDSSSFVQISGGSKDITIDGVTQTVGGGFATLASITSSDRVTIKNIGTAASKLTALTAPFHMLSLYGSCSDFVMANVHVATELNLDIGTKLNNGVVIQNSSMSSAPSFNPMNSISIAGLKIKGVQGLTLGNSAMNADAFSNVNTVTYDMFNTGGTAGQVGCLFQKESTPTIFSIVAGTPFFSDVGDLYMPTLNDEVHITWDYFIKGHSSLQNVAATIRTSVASATPASTNITVYYDIDNGSGFSGTWKLATGANLSGETINVAGFKPKFKLVTTTANAGNLVSIFYISTTTTQSAINANLYPIRPTIATLTVSPVVDNSEVRIYAAGTQTDLAGTENTSGGSFSYTYEHTADFDVDVQVMNNNYEYIKIKNVTLTDTSFTLPIEQVPDPLYFNP